MSQSDEGDNETVKSEENLPKKRRSPGRSVPAAFYDLSDSDVEAELVGYSEYEAQPDLIDTSTLGASIARHELIKLEETESDDQPDDGKSTEILDKIDDLASNDMLHDITIRGLQHLSLTNGNAALPVVVENLCTMRRKHQRLFNKLQQLRATLEQESARLNSTPSSTSTSTALQ